MKIMYRIKNHHTTRIGGICLGLAQQNHWNVNVVRTVFIILFFTPFPIGLIYGVLWIFLPIVNTEENSLLFKTMEHPPVNYYINTMSNYSKNNNVIGGIILIVLGVIFAFQTFFAINLFHYIGTLWPLILIGLGVYIILKHRDQNHNDIDNP